MQGEGPERIEIPHFCCKSRLGSDGRIYFTENSSSGGYQ